MSVNSFGHMFRFTTWGESHGKALGVVVDGCPPGLLLDEEWVQHYLDERKPGGPLATQRREPDKVSILSGVYEGVTTGCPISMVIHNLDQRSNDYQDMPSRARHADAAYEAKYRIRDPRGGGRASARETAARVAAGSVARLVIPEVKCVAHILSVGHEADPSLFEATIKDIRRDGDSVGATVQCTAEGVPAGWGAPIYAKLEAELGRAILSIPACKGFVMGDGDEMAQTTGSGVDLRGLSEGGTLGGISTGGAIHFRAFFKPTPSTAIRGVRGRHDPCVGWRAPPVVEAMAALVLADQKLMHRGQIG